MPSFPWQHVPSHLFLNGQPKCGVLWGPFLACYTNWALTNEIISAWRTSLPLRNVCRSKSPNLLVLSLLPYMPCLEHLKNFKRKYIIQLMPFIALQHAMISSHSDIHQLLVFLQLQQNTTGFNLLLRQVSFLFYYVKCRMPILTLQSLPLEDKNCRI